METANQEQWKDTATRHMGDIYHARGNSSCNEGDFKQSLDFYKKANKF